MSAYRHFTVKQEAGVTVLHLVDPHLSDTLSVTELEDELLELMSKQSPQKVVVDFEGVRHCSTAVINGLLRTKKRLFAAGGKLGLCGMKEPIREAYRILNLDGTVFKIYENRTRAIAAINLVE
jgi:anti-anti-sigma factor